MGMTDEDCRGLKGGGHSALELAYTIEDAVRVSGLSRTRLYELMGLGTLVGKKAGRRTIITGDSLRTLIENLPPANIRAPKQAA